MKLRKLISFFLVLIILASVIPVYAAPITYKDINSSHWAWTYVNDMSEKGYLKGFNDGTFKPEQNITFLQIMKLMAKLQEPNIESDAKLRQDTLNELKFKRGDSMQEINKYLKEATWAKDYLALCLNRNIVDLNTLKTVFSGKNLNKPVSRLDTSVYFAKALNLEAKANEKQSVVLPYTDASSIAAGKRKYLEVLLDVGLLNPEGKGKGKFDPTSGITRAEISKLLSIANSVNTNNPTTPQVPDSTNVQEGNSRGTILTTQFNQFSNVITIRPLVGKDMNFILNEKSSVKINLTPKSYLELKEGMEVDIVYNMANNEIISILASFREVKEETIVGKIKYISNNKDRLTLDYDDKGKLVTDDFTIDTNCEIIIAGKTSGINDLIEGVDGKFTIKDKVITKISYEFEALIIGTVTSVDNRYSLTVEHMKNGRLLKEDFDLSRDYTIYIDGKLGSYSGLSDARDIKKGQPLKLSLKDNQVIRIDIDKRSKIIGYIDSITPTNADYTLIVIDKTGRSHKLFIDRYTRFLKSVEEKDFQVKNTRNIRLIPSELKERDDVVIETEYDTISTIFAKYEESRISGTIKAITLKDKGVTEISLLNAATDKEEIYALAKDVTVRIDNSLKPISDLKPGFKISASLHNSLIVSVDVNYSNMTDSFTGYIDNYDSRNDTFKLYVTNSNGKYENYVVQYSPDTLILDPKVVSRQVLLDKVARAKSNGLKVIVVGAYDGRVIDASTITILGID